MDGDEETNRLGTYLRARRALVTPEQAGIPAGSRRRVAGLRREELALLAGISADYHLRLERRQDTNPSEQMSSALARVLQLDEVEHRYLLDLATPARAARPAPGPSACPPGCGPCSPLSGCRRSSTAARSTCSRRTGSRGPSPPRLRPGENRLRSLLLDPGERDFHADREAATEEFAGSFRRSARTPATRASSNSSGSCRCQRTVHGLWARHDVRRLAGGTATVHHPVVGELRLHRDKLPVDRLTLVLHYADGGSESAEKLRALASPATETGDGEESIERPPAREAGDSRESRWGP